jgi:two-component system C4-dicarboxylate transport sensor histidine kinase DctB
MRAEADEARTYGNADLVPLNWQVRARLDERTLRAQLDDVHYLASERAVNDGMWRVVLLDDEAPVRVSARWSGLSAALACAVLLLLLVALVQRRHAARLKEASRRALQAAHDGLEAKVLERTAELRAVQNDLIHAGKLAALGQMSAGVVHELNQPLAAMRTLSDNGAVLLRKGRLDDVQVNLERIANLTSRLARLTQQLKVFAHKASGPPHRVAVHNVVQNALLMGADRLRTLGIATVVEIEPETLSVLADEARLEQVLVNLVNNAIDAMAAAPERRLAIRAARRDDRGLIAVSDSGTGIDPDVLGRLFEPFITTKPAGKGLGLGLMISAHIVRELGGRLTASNLSPTGAEFVIELPIAP